MRVPWAERVNVSALTGRAVAKIAPALRTALASWDQRIPTGRLNCWLSDVIAATPPPVRGGKQPKVLFATQAQHPPADVRAVHQRVPGGGLPAVPGAPAAGGVRLLRHARSGSRCGCGRSAAARPDPAPDVPRRRCGRLVPPRLGCRDVAQFGSALDWGSRGRRFKSCRPDGEIGRCSSLRTPPDLRSDQRKRAR